MACQTLTGLNVPCGCCPDNSIVPCGCETGDFPTYDQPTGSEIGEQYYSETAGGTDTGFWQDLINPFLEDIGISYSQFYDVYGTYLPEDFALGPASLDRASRIADLKEDQFEDQFGRQRNTALQSIGASGFSGSGMQEQVLDDLWSQYSMQHSSLGMEEEQSYQDIYSAQGETILSSMQVLAGQGAFASDEPYEDIPEEEEEGGGAGDPSGSDTEPGDTSLGSDWMCWNQGCDGWNESTGECYGC